MKTIGCLFFITFLGGCHLNQSTSTLSDFSVSQMTPLMYSAKYVPNIDVMEILIQQGHSVNATTSTGWTPLMFAVSYNPNPKTISYLISKNADINKKTTLGNTALDFAQDNPNLINTPELKLLENKTLKKDN